MTELSPAAQAVLTAATQRLYCLDPEDVPLSASEHGNAIAAALRAAVDQAVPEYREHCTATLDERYRKVSAFDIRNRFLAIAAQLEAQ